ncbi:hypothetical protein ACFPRL_24060 [Pseudoclavibacter helvolus]
MSSSKRRRRSGRASPLTLACRRRSPCSRQHRRRTDCGNSATAEQRRCRRRRHAPP